MQTFRVFIQDVCDTFPVGDVNTNPIIASNELHESDGLQIELRDTGKWAHVENGALRGCQGCTKLLASAFEQTNCLPERYMMGGGVKRVEFS